MIQRIQSIYLLLIFFTAIAMLFLPLVTFTGYQDGGYNDHYLHGIKLVHSDGQISDVPNMADVTGYLLIGTAFISFISIFLYKNRRNQKLAAKFILLLATGVLYLLVQSHTEIKDSLGGEAEIKIGFYFPVVIMLLSMLVIRSIKKDEDLIKAADRLR